MFPLRILRILSLEHILATAYEKEHTEHIKSQICLFSRKIAGCVSDDIFRWVMFSFQLNIVGNKAKGRISKRVFQENKAHQIFRKTNISYHTKTHHAKFSEKRTLLNKCMFFGKFGVLCFLETTVLRFALWPYYRRYHKIYQETVTGFYLPIFSWISDNFLQILLR